MQGRSSLSDERHEFPYICLPKAQDFVSVKTTEAFSPLPPRLNRTSITLRPEEQQIPGDLPRSRLSPTPRLSDIHGVVPPPPLARANKPGARTHTSTTTRLQPSEQDPPTTRRRARKQASFDKLRLPSVWQRKKAGIFI